MCSGTAQSGQDNKFRSDYQVPLLKIVVKHHTSQFSARVPFQNRQRGPIKTRYYLHLVIAIHTSLFIEGPGGTSDPFGTVPLFLFAAVTPPQPANPSSTSLAKPSLALRFAGAALSRSRTTANLAGQSQRRTACG